MSGAIINLVWGVPLTPEAQNKIQDWCSTGIEFDEYFIQKGDRVRDAISSFGFEVLYSAYGSMERAYLGKRFKTFKEGEPIALGDLTGYVLTDFDKGIILSEFERLPYELRSCLGEPDYYIIWSNS